MNQARAVDGVLAVVAGVVVTARDIDRTLPHEREENRARRQGRRSLHRIIGIKVAAVAGDRVPGEGVRGSGQGNAGRCRVARVMIEPCERHGRVRAATLMIQTQRVGAGEVHADAVIDQERQRRAHPRDHQPVLARRLEATEIGLIHLLVRRRAVGPTGVGTSRQRPREHGGAAIGIDDLEAAGGRDSHLAQVADIIADHRFLGEVRQVAFLIDVDGWIVTQRIGRGDELRVR